MGQHRGEYQLSQGSVSHCGIQGSRDQKESQGKTNNEKGIWWEGLESMIVWSARGHKSQ